MSDETEIKLPFSDLEAAETALQSLPLQLKKKKHFEENFVLDTPTRSLRNEGKLLRVRIVDGKGLLTYKGKLSIKDAVRSREEIECELQEPQNLLKIFEALGYTISFRYQKYRTIFEVEGEHLDICLDETPIGIYFELEGEIPKIHEYAARLGFDRSEYITDSYTSLYFRWCKEKEIVPSHMIFV
jgi:adenylate cyclase class 2